MKRGSNPHEASVRLMNWLSGKYGCCSFELIVLDFGSYGIDTSSVLHLTF